MGEACVEIYRVIYQDFYAANLAAKQSHIVNRYHQVSMREHAYYKLGAGNRTCSYHNSGKGNNENSPRVLGEIVVTAFGRFGKPSKVVSNH